MADVTMTIEPEPHGYAQHMITVERSGPAWDGVTGCLMLTERELYELGKLIARQQRQSGDANSVTATFADTTGRDSD